MKITPLRPTPAPEATERPDLQITRILKSDGEVLERITEPAELLPDLDLPQPTEPMHLGRSFTAAARHAAARGRRRGWMRRLLSTLFRAP